MRTLRWVMFVLAASVCGCASVKLQGSHPAGLTRLAVFDFSDAHAYKATRDYFLAGACGTEAPGRLVARWVRKRLSACPEFSVAEWREAGLKLGKEKLSRDAASFSADDAIAQGKLLGVDAVVVGEVHSYKSVWFLFVQWAAVSFDVKCFDARTGRQLWSAKAGDTGLYAIEEDLALDLAGEMCRKLRAGLRIQPAK